MVKIANECKNTTFLAFTKNYTVVNTWINENGNLPENLRIVFSGWRKQNINNQHCLPASFPIFADGYTDAKEGAKFCPGNCAKCAKTKSLCWSAKIGEQIIFPIH